jgi:serine/threonine protein kinase
MGPRIFLLPKEDRILKIGIKVNLSEAEAMRFVACKISIPVPTVHDAYEQEGRSYIFMSRVHGKPLGQVWNSLATEQKASIVRQLHHYVAELGTLSGDFYGALWDSPCGDIFFHHHPFQNEKIQYGPYVSRQEYNAGLVAALANSRPDQTLSASDQALAEKLLQLDDERKPFSHGDLHPSNIIVDDTCRVTGIVDWESAGFSIPVGTTTRPSHEHEKKSGQKLCLVYFRKMHNRTTSFFGSLIQRWSAILWSSLEDVQHNIRSSE